MTAATPETAEPPSRVHPLIASLVQTRKDRGLSQEALARRLGITQTALSYWENGRRDPAFSHVVEWAAALGIRDLGYSGPPPGLAALLGQVRRELVDLIGEIDGAGRRQP